MVERLSPLDHLRSAAYALRMAAVALADRVDSKYANALNPPEEYPRIYIDAVEAPVATEEELGGAA